MSNSTTPQIETLSMDAEATILTAINASNGDPFTDDVSASAAAKSDRNRQLADYDIATRNLNRAMLTDLGKAILPTAEVEAKERMGTRMATYRSKPTDDPSKRDITIRFGSMPYKKNELTASALALCLRTPANLRFGLKYDDHCYRSWLPSVKIPKAGKKFSSEAKTSVSARAVPAFIIGAKQRGDETHSLLFMTQPAQSGDYDFKPTLATARMLTQNWDYLQQTTRERLARLASSGKISPTTVLSPAGLGKKDLFAQKLVKGGLGNRSGFFRRDTEGYYITPITDVAENWGGYDGLSAYNVLVHFGEIAKRMGRVEDFRRIVQEYQSGAPKHPFIE